MSFESFLAMPTVFAGGFFFLTVSDGFGGVACDAFFCLLHDLLLFLDIFAAAATTASASLRLAPPRSSSSLSSA